MKANKAPKKIYITPHFQRRWFTKEIDDESTEYIRTDVFIEKAEKFFEENIEEEECKIGCSEWIELRSEYKSLDSFIRAFRKYMKGE